jgi:hypothetical protein
MKESYFDLLLASVRQAGEIRRGTLDARKFEVLQEDVTRIRAGFEKSRRPEGPARALLRVAAANPLAFQAALEPKRGSRPTPGTK